MTTPVHRRARAGRAPARRRSPAIEAWWDNPIMAVPRATLVYETHGAPKRERVIGPRSRLTLEEARATEGQRTIPMAEVHGRARRA